ncbi:MAG: hypothetical protein H7A40_05645 [Chlamydiales bacterium]|nr:hypothetical protein [Chlamydiales bacterium]
MLERKKGESEMSSDAGGQRPIQGYRQYESTQKDIEEPIDKDEFQKKIKEVESATEAPHKKKREQAEDDGTGLEGLNQPQHVFDTKKDVEPSPFEVQSPQSGRRQTYQGQKGATMEFIEEPTPPSAAPKETPTPFAPPPPSEKQASPQPLPPSQPQSQPSSQLPPQPPSEKSQTEQQPKQQPSQASSNTSEPSEKQAQQAASLPPSPVKSNLTQEKEPQTFSPQKEPKKAISKTAESDEKTPITHAPASEIEKIQKEKSQKAKEEQGAAVEGITPSDQPAGTGNVIEPTAAMSSSPLNPLSPIYELFNNMVSHITIEHAKSGLQTTTVQISMKNSAFDGAKLKLERFPTARDTFNVQLSSDNPKAVDLFNANMQQLTTAFQAGRYPFKVNINRAIHEGESAKDKAKRVNRKGDVG